MKKTKKLNSIILLFQLLMSVVTLFLLVKLNILSPQILMIVLAVIGLLFLISFGILKGTKKFKTGRFFSIFMSIILLVTSVFLYRTDLLFSVISNGDIKTNTISFVAMKDSGYTKLSEVVNHDFGFSSAGETNYIEDALAKVNSKKGNAFSGIPENNNQILIDTFYDGAYEVIIIDEAQRGFINEYHDNFDEETIVLHQEFFIEKIDAPTGSVNVTKDTFSFFISGIDTYGPVSSVSRSDVNMILTVDPVNNQMLLTGIPRDYHVVLPKFNALDKLTHAGVYGVEESMAALENLLDIDLDYFVRVNFNSVEKIVNSLGGVTVHSDYAFSVDGFSYVKGDNQMDGAKALRFVRERKLLPGGDESRVANQAALMSGIINKALSPATLANYGPILSSVSDSLQLSMPEGEMKAFIRSQVNAPASWAITNYGLTGRGAHSRTTYSMPGWNLYVMEPDLSSVACGTQLINALENHEVIPTSKDGIKAFCQ